MIEVKCDNCNTIFSKHKCYLKLKNFCSVSCHNQYQSLINSVEKICKICGDMFRVPKCYENRFSSCKNFLCRKKNKEGSNNSNFRNSPRKRRDDSRKEYKEWRKNILLRDNYRCVECNSLENLEVDHILPYAYYPELRYELSNGRVLCRVCHHKEMKKVFIHRKETGYLTLQPIEIKSFNRECIICGDIFSSTIHNKKVCGKNICIKKRNAEYAKYLRSKEKENERF